MAPLTLVGKQKLKFPFSHPQQLKFAQLKDTGTYECQISTTPPKGYPGTLKPYFPLSPPHQTTQKKLILWYYAKLRVM